MRAMRPRTHRDERLGNWLALLALLAGSIVFAPPRGAAPPAGHAAGRAPVADRRGDQVASTFLRRHDVEEKRA